MSVKYFFSVFLFFCICIGSTAAAATTIRYSYDKNGRLTEVAYNSNRISYQYDLNGNLIEYSYGSVFSWVMFLPAIEQGKIQATYTPVIDKNGSIRPALHSNSSK